MFKFQIRDMKRAVRKNLNARRPPRHLYIMKSHADYLKCPYETTDSIFGPDDEPPEFEPGVKIGSIVRVTLLDLFQSLRDAKGVDEQDGNGNF